MPLGARPSAPPVSLGPAEASKTCTSKFEDLRKRARTGPATPPPMMRARFVMTDTSIINYLNN